MFRTFPGCCAGERVADWLLKVAIARRANHYQRDFDPTLPADLPAISDGEIGVALCLGQNPYSLDAVRVAAQFLSSPRINAERLCNHSLRILGETSVALTGLGILLHD